MADDQDTKDEMQGRLIGAGAVSASALRWERPPVNSPPGSGSAPSSASAWGMLAGILRK
jgi:hypothetical protein